MSSETTFDIGIIGGGIVGLATAMAVTRRHRGRVLVVEAERELATHQTGHNSGVIHSGLYYKPGSRKALDCGLGRELMYRFCEEHGISCERCGKIVVATTASQVERLESLHSRGIQNGLLGLRRLDANEIKEFEPHVAGLAGLHVPQTGIVDFVGAARKFGEIAANAGAVIRKDCQLLGVRQSSTELVLETTGGDFRSRSLVNCGGLHSDRVARLCGLRPSLKIIPFRGEYFELVESRWGLVRNLIYPVPDPRFPFLGVHFTRMAKGGVEAGPNAVLALGRHGYRKFKFTLRDAVETLTYRGFWRLAIRYWQTAIGDLYRSYNKRAFVRELQRLVPELQSADVVRTGPGVRAQAVTPDGRLVDDFHIQRGERMIHVLNAPSPAATASISIGETIAEMAAEQFDLN
ncbi:MAG: L-2-hydroxyglutarate oxidase [Pirellulales bacterium]